MTKQSIIFFDIDGTLFDHDKKLPVSTKEAILQLKETGHIVAIATGRAPFMFADLRKALGIDTYVSYNGQYVVLDGEVIYTNLLKTSSLVNLAEKAHYNHHPVVFMDQEGMKANVSEHPFIKESIDTLKIDRYPTYDPYYYEDRELYQAFLFCREGEEQQYVAEFKDFHFIRWHEVSLDIVPKGGSKANGIEKIVKQLGIPKEKQYAFGDALNDMEMLQSVENSVAMGNAVDDVKKAAKYVTRSVDDHGIYHGLKMLNLI